MAENEILNHAWTYDELWQGCILMSIAHAMFIADAPELAYENSWDGRNYSLNNSQGSRGTITFNSDFYVAGFRNDAVGTDGISANEYLAQAPKEIIELAEKEAFQYMLDEVKGEVRPSITTTLWGDRNRAFSSHPYDTMLERGGDLLAIPTLDIEAAFLACEENYEFTVDQLSLLKRLFYIKIKQPDDTIFLTQIDRDIIGANDAEGIFESKASFAEIGIEWE